MDGTDDLGRDVDAAAHGVYKIPAQFVTPGTYRVRGLVRGAIEPRYELSIYSAGDPAWTTADSSGGWLTNHTPPQAALFLPGEKSPTNAAMVYLGSAVSEGGAGLAWVDLDGKKIGGRGWIGGNWTAAPYLARDDGAKGLPEVFAYVGATWTASTSNADKTHGELRITALTAKGDRPVIKYPFTPPVAHDGAGEGDNHWVDQLAGLAVRDGLLVASMNKLGTLLFIDAHDGKVRGERRIESPRGLAFDAQGRLLVLSEARLLRYEIDAGEPAALATAAPLIARGLEDPRGITIDARGNIFISDGGGSHQVKVFAPDGKLLRVIGKAGAPQAGPYDPLHMNNPAGMAIDADDRLWVTEKDFLPKRVSVWNRRRHALESLTGPAKYGRGGTLDSQDKTRFYYARRARLDGIQVGLGQGRLAVGGRVVSTPAGYLRLPSRSAAPELPIGRNGRRYFTNCFNSNPTGGHATAFVFIEKDGIARPVAGIGRARDWELLETERFASRLPAGADRKDNSQLFLWSDANGDAQVQTEEVTFQASGVGGGVTVMPDLSFCVARVGDKAMRFAPSGFSAGGAPQLDLAKGGTLASGVQPPASSGGDQVLAGASGWTVVTLGIVPFARHSLSGARNGQAQWSYPNLWPGLHASHEAPTPDRPGELIGPTRLMGGFISPKNSDAGEIWA